MHRTDTRYTIDFQVWRPAPTVNRSTGVGCYSLVGNNRVTSLNLRGSVAVVTPSPQDYIQFSPGDIVGFYVEEADEGERSYSNGVILRTEPSRLASEMVWYASIVPSSATSHTGQCPYSVGRDGVLNRSTHAAPVISISAGKLNLHYQCAVILPI